MEKFEHVVIFGAGSDIAKEMARLLAKRNKGIKLTLLNRNIQRLEPFKKNLEIRFKCIVKLIEFDAFLFDSHKEIVDKLDESQLCVVAFGILGNQQDSQAKFSLAKQIIDSNYTGAVSVLEKVGAQYELRKSGIIVGISSVAGERGRQSNYLYGSAKAGFTAYLSGLRNRLFKSKVHVLTVLPGFMDTKMTSHLNLTGPLTSSDKYAAGAILKAIYKKNNVVYVKFVWRYIMLIIKNIPEFIFKKLST